MVAVSGCGACTQLVHLPSEALDRANVEPMRAASRAIRLAHSSVLAGTAEHIPRHPARAQGSGPQTQPGQVDPAKPRMKIGYDFAFGKVTVSGEPEAAAASSFSACSVENTPCPR